MNPRLTCLGALCFAIATVTAQEPDRPSRWIVSFAARSFRLDGFRRAVLARDAAQVAAEVARMERTVIADQAPFARAVARLGGRVTRQWWLINGCAVELPSRAIAELRALPGVTAVEPDVVRTPLLVVAADNLHHGSASANRVRDARGRLVLGTGTAVAILDTGADLDSGGKNRPHACYYPGGNPNNNQNPGIGGSLLLRALKVNVSPTPDDRDGHGTAVAACAAANKWNADADVGDGVAPGAGVVSVDVTDSTGLSTDAWIIEGWQAVAALRVALDIGAGNNSFTGSPDLSNSLQRALDSTAYNADMLITVSAGNAGTNTSQSQHAFNGLAVGSIDKQSKTRSSFSAIGPLHGTRRTYPDLVAVGNGLVLPAIDDETKKSVLGGTSYAAPMVAGAAALLRQAAPDLCANEVRALLLNTAEFRGVRDGYGLGMIKVDTAVQAAMADSVVPGAVRSGDRIANFEFTPTAAGARQVTVAWMRSDFTTSGPPDIDLRIYDSGNQVVASDLNPENSYESVRFNASANQTYRVEVRWVNPPVTGGELQFAVAGATNHAAPSLAGVAPSSVVGHAPEELLLSGDSLSTVQYVSFGPFDVEAVTVLDDHRILVTPPRLLPIGPVPVRVTTPYGTSQPQALQVTAPATPVIVAPGVVARGTNHTLELFSGRGWRSLLLGSTSNLPSVVPGIFHLGIGNAWQDPLLPVVFLGHDASGAAQLPLPIPVAAPLMTVYLQALSIDPAAPVMPFPASNVHGLTIR